MTFSWPVLQSTDSTWMELAKHIKISRPRGDDDTRHTFLGGTYTHTTHDFDGHTTRCVEAEAVAAGRKGLAKYEVAVYEMTDNILGFMQ